MQDLQDPPPPWSHNWIEDALKEAFVSAKTAAITDADAADRWSDAKFLLQHYFGMRHIGGARWSEAAAAEPILRSFAEEGNTHAQCLLALVLLYRDRLVSPSEDAMEWLRRAAAQGLPLAKDCLGVLYLLGTGVSQDVGEALRYFNRAAEDGLALAQFHLGDYYYRKSAWRDEEAGRLFQLAAAQGHAEAQARLAHLYEDGSCGIPRDRIEALRFYRQAALNGSPEAQLRLAKKYEKGEGLSKDDDEASYWFGEAAYRFEDSPNRYTEIGLELGRCRLERKEFEAAVKLFQDCARTGNTTARLKLAEMYANGRGVEQDQTEAARLFQLVADDIGHLAKNASREMGLRYAEGKGVAKDPTKALEYLRRAAEQSDAEASCQIGDMYADGDSVPQDSAEAIRWWTRAVEAEGRRGYHTKFEVARQFFLGRGVPVDMAEASRWFKEAVKTAIRNHGATSACLEIKSRASDFADPGFLKAAVRESLQELWAEKDSSTSPGRWFFSYIAFQIAEMYEDNADLDGDPIKWYLAAAERGTIEPDKHTTAAHYQLARLYAEEMSDHARAISHLDTYCGKVSLDSIKNWEAECIADLWQKLGQFEREAEYRSLAASQDGRSRFRLGEMYAAGQGVPQAFELAHMWFNLAAASGIEDAAKRRDAMAVRMEASQLAEAQRMAEEWHSRQAASTKT